MRTHSWAIAVLLPAFAFGCSDAGPGGSDGPTSEMLDGGGPGGPNGNASGTGGVSSSGGPLDGAGGTGSGGTAGEDNECLPVVDRCDCVVAADGVNVMVDAFEDGDQRINVIDSRDGEWFQARGRQSQAPLGNLVVENAALHLSGGATTLSPAMGEGDDWATFGVPLGQCYDASPYAGFRFRIKGNTSAGNNDTVRFSISTPPTTEVSAGGTCPDLDVGCYNHFGMDIVLTSEWQEVTATWAELTQNATWGIKAPPGYDKKAHIMAVNFAPLENTKGYDFWIDDVQFTTAGGTNCTSLIDEAKFNALFPGRNAFYTYQAFADAVAQFPSFCGEGTDDDKLRDVAALFAHTIQETGGNVADPTTGLVHIEEIAKGPYCDGARADFPCASGKQYFGRGPLQLTWNYNYGTAGQALGLPLLAQPELVSAQAVNAFKAALWFWMTRQPLKSPHSLMVTGAGFGETIRLVNGPLECDGKAPAKTANRVAAFKHFCTQLGTTPGENLDCQ